MASTIHCDIVSAEAEIFSGEASMVIVPGEQGDLGIAPRHAPLLTRLRPGQVRVILPSGEEEFYYVSGGMLEIQPHVVSVLSDTAQRAGDLDEAAALKAKEEAERAIADRSAGLEVAQAQAQLAQAMAQLAALERFRKQVKR
jgi:F-type H+-transporting ATPase subunit epsilon